MWQRRASRLSGTPPGFDAGEPSLRRARSIGCWRGSGQVLVVFLGTLLLTGLLFVAIPKGLFPEQDTGQLQAVVAADQGVSFARMAQIPAAGRRCDSRGSAMSRASAPTSASTARTRHSTAAGC